MALSTWQNSEYLGDKLLRSVQTSSHDIKRATLNVGSSLPWDGVLGWREERELSTSVSLFASWQLVQAGRLPDISVTIASHRMGWTLLQWGTPLVLPPRVLRAQQMCHQHIWSAQSPAVCHQPSRVPSMQQCVTYPPECWGRRRGYTPGLFGSGDRMQDIAHTRQMLC